MYQKYRSRSHEYPKTPILVWCNVADMSFQVRIFAAGDKLARHSVIGINWAHAVFGLYPARVTSAFDGSQPRGAGEPFNGSFGI